MYYIYKIAYKISDEMKAQKEAERPFWWQYLHDEVKEKPLEEVEKELLEGEISKEYLDTMTRYEKYLVVSSTAYVVQCKETDNIKAELETLKKDVERSKTNFLNQSPASQVKVEDNFEPIVFGQAPAVQNTIPSGDSPFTGSSPAVQATDGLPPKEEGISHSPIDAPGLNPLESPVQNTGPKDDLSSLSGGLNNGSAQKQPMSGSDIRKYAQAIVAKTVNDINAKADSVPDDVAMLKEKELLDAVINELQNIRY